MTGLTLDRDVLCHSKSEVGLGICGMNQIAKNNTSILVEHVKKIVVDHLDMTRPKGPLLGIQAVEEKNRSSRSTLLK